MTNGKPTLTKVIINGITIKDDSDTTASNYLINWSMNDLNSSDFMKSISIVCSRSIQNALIISDVDLIGQTVLVYRGETTSTDYIVFRGTVRSYSQQGGVITFDCIDKLYETTKRTVVYSFDKDVDTEAGVVSEIFKTLITDYTTNLTADATSVQSTGTINILSKFICKSETVYDLCKKLADAMSWIFYYNPEDDKVHFEPKGFTNNSTILQNGVNIVKTPKWISDSSLLFNKIRVDGAYQEVLTTETGRIGTTTGYTTSYIQLTQIPVTIRVLCDAANPPTTEKKLGVPDSTSPYDYYGDKTKKRVVWNTGTFTPGASDYVIVQYTFNRPTPIVVSDATSISSYGLNEKTIEKKDLTTVTDATLYATSYLSDHKNPILSTELKVTNVLDLDIGQSVRIIDFNNNIDAYFKIIEIKREYPYNFDTVKVTSDILEETDYLVMIDRKLKELERANQDDYEFLIERVDFDNTEIYENRYVQITRTSLSGSNLIWDNDTFGIWGAAKWYDPAAAPLTVNIVLDNILNQFIELFYDTEFKDASTTADWDTTNQWLEVTDTEMAVSKSFLYENLNPDNNYYKTVNFTITGTAVDKLTYYIGEYDNATITYTEVPTTGTTTSRLGSLVILGTNKYGLNWKVENTSGSTGKITKLQIDYTKG